MAEQPSPADCSDLSSELESGTSKPTKTPLFEANNSARYNRQTLIKQIQDRTKSRLICYMSGSGPECAIDANDIAPFVDLLYNVPENHNLDLLLHTNGGSIDAAERLMGMLRSRVGTAELRIIVPDSAKSAGTLMVLGADSVVMSDMSELGPIDPQAFLSGRWQSVQHYLDAYEEHAARLKSDPGDLAAQIMLHKLVPAELQLCEAAVGRARQAAENLLRRGMFRKNDGNWTRTVSELLDTKRWLSHGQMISWEDAKHPLIGLEVKHYAYDAVEWQDYWRLYCLQRLAIEDRQKLYESDYASLIIDQARVK